MHTAMLRTFILVFTARAFSTRFDAQFSFQTSPVPIKHMNANTTRETCENVIVGFLKLTDASFHQIYGALLNTLAALNFMTCRRMCWIRNIQRRIFIV